MLKTALTGRFSTRRLRALLVVFFLALAVPTAVLIWQTYSQLKWESFHQYRGVAEELTQRIDARLMEMVDTADTRSFGDYSFLVVTGDPSANFLQRSPLSEYPVRRDLPGVIGYFQVDPDGEFGTPLLPPTGTAIEKLGIDPAEYSSRLEVARQIQTVLADNKLAQSRPDGRMRHDFASTLEEEAPPPDKNVDEERDIVELRSRRLEAAGVDSTASVPAGIETGSSELMMSDDAPAAAVISASSADKDEFDNAEAVPMVVVVDDSATYSQQAFDNLNQPKEGAKSSAGLAGVASPSPAAAQVAGAEQARQNTIGKVADIKLDDAYQEKSEAIEREAEEQKQETSGRAIPPARTKRREQTAIPESATPLDRLAVADPSDLRISTFESEVDPLEFSLLDSGHMVLFRKVWRDGDRYIQGLLIDQSTFIHDVVDSRFYETSLAGMSNLIVAYQDDVIYTAAGRDNNRYQSGYQDLDGALLYRNRLSAPVDSLELIYTITQLPPGPGAGVLGWVTIVLAIVFVGGFYTLYRLGVGQISLARQQQDFVSAVSHELKTPLTSIRMYGEMLKEGWADDEKRQSYYEFIHDESERLTRLISNVLQLAKITRNEPQFDMKARSVSELMSQIDSKIASQVERAGFELRFDRDRKADACEVTVDDDCFTQIIINLIDNAIKFSKDAETRAIEISSALTNSGEIVFSIRDYGPGIPKNQMKKIFELFYRSESELTRETVGTGIGLAIVHQLTQAMNGGVDVVNADPGVEFRVSFPRA